MRLSTGGTRAYPYKVIIPPKNGAVSLETFKAHLRIGNCNQDEILQVYLNAAITHAEVAMGLDLITRTYKTWRDFFPQAQNEGFYHYGQIPESFNEYPQNTGFELRRSPFKALASVMYANIQDNVLTPVNGEIYYVTQSVAGNFSNILNNPGKFWPADSVVPRQDAIEIEFTSGFGDNEDSIPADIKTAIVEHGSKMFFERGDCADCSNSLPAIAKATYAKNKVVNL